MQPITHTARQLRVLCAFTNQHNERVSAVMWQPDCVFATDGHRLLVVPLPNDPERDFALRSADIEPWLIGYPDVPEEGADEDDQWLARNAPRVAPAMAIERFDDASMKVYVTGSRTFLVAALCTIERPVISSTARKLAFDGPSGFASHTCDPKLLADVHGARAAFGVGYHSVRLVAYPGGMEPIVYGFDAEHGEARYVLMGTLMGTRK